MIEKNCLLYDVKYQTSNQLLTIFPQIDYLLHYCQSHNQPLIHFWQTTPTVILGLRDKHLDHLSEGIQYLKAQNYQVLLRNAGGLAVVSDPGVMNLSLLLPDATNLSIDQAYFLMFKLIQASFTNLKIDHYEVKTSYCPGSFDLVVNHQKIAGIAQRRNQNAVAIMAYLSIQGNQQQRGEVLQHFYQLANHQKNPRYPAVDPTSMANLAAFDSHELTIAQFKQHILKVIKQHANCQLLTERQLTHQMDYTSFLQQKLIQQQHLNQAIMEDSK
ncbi:lipoate--protein ligase [Bombilactobacillus folatiphilus]|uniref:Lipoate--protein ligase n=1 Tax=Bombilactobacillus folatiphilus TaxID=2923362 RepID=A0ABY4P9K7_9LACO|nr:lipoate--protein ligase [Bombilactobacillus folatiphilus]UQS82312.1 lipoate--protein ligase [Bombilactobacillus folatiphilus]